MAERLSDALVAAIEGTGVVSDLVSDSARRALAREVRASRALLRDLRGLLKIAAVSDEAAANAIGRIDSHLGEEG